MKMVREPPFQISMKLKDKMENLLRLCTVIGSVQKANCTRVKQDVPWKALLLLQHVLDVSDVLSVFLHKLGVA